MPKENVFSPASGLSRRLVLKTGAAAAAVAGAQGLAIPAFAAGYPERNISVIVPTVERGEWPVVRCSIAMAGERPSIDSTRGFCSWPTNWRA